MHDRSWLCSMAAVLLALLGASPFLAQTTTARMVGTGRDSSGAALPHVEVTVRNVDTHTPRTVRSNGSGGYVATSLIAGRYEVSAGFTGFKRYGQGPLTLEVEQTARVDITLQPGSITGSVTVEAVNPMVESDRGLARLLPGMTDGAALTSNGQRAEGNNYLLAGTDSSAALFGVAVVTPCRSSGCRPAPARPNTGGRRVQFRGELFNATNHPNFGLPGSSFASTSFAGIRSANSPRQVQFAVKYLL